LLVSCDPACADEVLALFAREGFHDACVIGQMAAGPVRIDVAV
jgi:selenide,water dikinase